MPADIPRIRLWENGAPGALGETEADQPVLGVFRAPGADPATPGPAVIILPGGGYMYVSASGGEGVSAARWFNQQGITAFVLRYRVAPYRHPVGLDDARRAIRLVRSRAAEFGIAPDKIGLLGFSAGGHLAASAGVFSDAGRADATDPVERTGSRPDFLVLAYPVISFQPAIAGPNNLAVYAGSGRNLLGPSPDPKLIDELSLELRVTPQTPPTFLYHGNADTGVTAENSVQFYLALKRAGVPTELHLFEKGRHATGLSLNDPVIGVWPNLMLTWLRGRGFLPATPISAAPSRP